MRAARNGLTRTSSDTRARRVQLKTQPPLRICIIGGGRMGTTLGRALRSAGHRIQLVVTRHDRSARRAAKLIGGGAKSFTESDLNRPDPATLRSLYDSDMLLISTPDDALQHAARQLAAAFSSHSRGSVEAVALHTSGALASDVLAPLRARGFATGSVHPLVSIAADADVKEVFRGAFFCVEGDRKAMTVARALVRDLNGQSFTISAKAKPLYHAAAVMSSGYVVALFDVAVELLKECGLSASRAQQILLPLLKSAATNLTTRTPAQALTGPIARGDVMTTRKHLVAMRGKNLSEAVAIYSLLSRRALKLAGTTKSGRKHLQAIARLLASKPGRAL